MSYITNYFVDLRVEWLRCRARAARWIEEIQLVEEEMRRAIEFCRWQASEWERQAHRRAPSLTDQHVIEGIVAYAFEQAADEREREKQWTEHWSAIRQRAKVVLDELLSGQYDSAFDKKETSDGSLDVTIEDTDDSDADLNHSDVED